MDRLGRMEVSFPNKVIQFLGLHLNFTKLQLVQNASPIFMIKKAPYKKGVVYKACNPSSNIFIKDGIYLWM